MRKWLLFLTVLVVLAGAFTACKRNNQQTTAAQPPLQLTPSAPVQPPPTLLRIHFAGTDEISSNKNSIAFTNEFGCAEARALEDQTLDKLSRAPGTWFKDKLPTGADDGSAQLRPLLDDFLKSEWVLEMRGATDSPEYALAIRLNDTRAQLWQTNLRSLLESWTKISARDITNGWELKKDLRPNLFRFVRTGDWVVLGCGQDKLPLSDEWIQTGTSLEKEASWLSVDVDWPKLQQFFPALAKFDFPVTSLQVTGTNGMFVLTGKFDLAQPLPPLDKWQIPTNIIHQPLISFTAARGFGPWLQNQSWSGLLNLSPEPSQLISWALGRGPLETYVALPVPDATNAMAQVDQNLTDNTNWQKRLLINFQKTVTTNRISWQGFPYINPELRALRETNGDFLMADIYPMPPFGRMAPTDLYRAFSGDNVVFYHWEITATRLQALPEVTQILLLLTKHREFDLNGPAAQWLSRIGPTLGNSVTEVVETGPTELVFTRSAPAGLTAVELMILANWLQASNFPGCDLSPPPRPKVLHGPHGPVKTLSAPVPGPPPAPVHAPAPPLPPPH
jgi:hypothetical protein